MSLFSYNVRGPGEITSLIISVIVVSLVFTGWNNLITLNKFHIATAFIGVSTAFLFHELAHRFVARRYGCYAKHVLNPFGLVLTLFTMFLPLRIIITGYVSVFCIERFLNSYGIADSRKVNAYIALAGPLTNIIIAILFWGLIYAPIPYIYVRIFSYASFINLWIAFFNLIPIPPLDGSKIFSYKPVLSISLLLFAIILMVAQTW